jgi:thiol-disulfide isomerase/thioredoxin
MEFAVPLNKKPESTSIDNTREIIHINSQQNREDIIKDNKLVVIKYSAEWCGPCQKIAPAYLEMCQADPDVVYCEEDVDEEFEGYAEKILSIPVFHVFLDGNFTSSSKGTSLDALKKIIDDAKNNK